MTTQRAYIPLAADREAVALALVRSGYTVRLGREKPPGKTSYLHFVEYWIER